MKNGSSMYIGGLLHDRPLQLGGDKVLRRETRKVKKVVKSSCGQKVGLGPCGGLWKSVNYYSSISNTPYSSTNDIIHHHVGRCLPTLRIATTLLSFAIIEWTRGINSNIKPVAILSLQATYYNSQRHGLIYHIILQRQPSTFPIVHRTRTTTTDTGKQSLYPQYCNSWVLVPHPFLTVSFVLQPPIWLLHLRTMIWHSLINDPWSYTITSPSLCVLSHQLPKICMCTHGSTTWYTYTSTQYHTAPYERMQYLSPNALTYIIWHDHTITILLEYSSYRSPLYTKQPLAITIKEAYQHEILGNYFT
jgi:hypothetical protein